MLPCCFYQSHSIIHSAAASADVGAHAADFSTFLYQREFCPRISDGDESGTAIGAQQRPGPLTQEAEFPPPSRSSTVIADPRNPMINPVPPSQELGSTLFHRGQHLARSYPATIGMWY